MKSHDPTGVVLGETPHSHCELNIEFLIIEHLEIFDCSRVFVTPSETTERAKRKRSLEGCAIRALHWGPDWILTIPRGRHSVLPILPRKGSEALRHGETGEGHMTTSNRMRLKPRPAHPRASCLTTMLFLEENKD